MRPNELLEICLDNNDRDTFLEKLPTNIHINMELNAGELKDRLAELTSYYAYFAELLATSEYVLSSLEEFVDEHSSRMRLEQSNPYSKSRKVKRDQDDDIRFVSKISSTCCGIIFKGRDIQYFKNLILSVRYVRDHVKFNLSTIDKTISVGNTVLSYEKLELKNLGVA